MKLIKSVFLIAGTALAICGVSSTGYGFHDGGVANCESCHTMHNSLTGRAMADQGGDTLGAPGSGNPAASNSFLLRGSDQSSTCLNCHEGATATGPMGHLVSTPAAKITSAANKAPFQRGPGGDFGWLRSATATSGVAPATLNRRGHNIVAVDFGYSPDSENILAPGGTFIASRLSCISCHNPHNQLRRTSDSNNTFVKPSVGTKVYGIAASGSDTAAPAASVTAPVGPYRFLRGTDSVPASYAYPFTANPPAVVAPSYYNRPETTADTHVAYGAGMSDWCGNCHAAMNDSLGASNGSSGHPHPVNKAIGTEMAKIYNAYKGSGDLTGGPNGYSSLVPVEMATTDYAVLKAAASSSNGGNYLAATASSKVMCLSCHRAHASGFPSMTRFKIDGYMTAANGTDYVLANGMVNASQALAAYYDRPASQFGPNSKQLCNKCHNKD